MNFNSSLFRIAFAALLSGNCAGFAQSISGFTPMFCSTNEFVQITGSGFSAAIPPAVTNVIFSNNKSVRVTPTADNQINVVVPFGATTGPIQVKKGASIVTSVDDLTVIGTEPYITSFSPTSGASNTVVTVNGVHFTGTTSVRFNGTNAAFTPPTTDTQIIITAPTGVTTGPISITRSNAFIGTSSSNFFAPPSITSFSPSVGRAGTNVVITGKNFVGATFVKFNSVSALSYTVNSNTQITVTVPANASTGLINISTPGGQTFSSSNFVVMPSIFSFSPYFGKVGTNVTIVGANLNGTTNVFFNGVAASFSGVTSNQVTAIVPPTAASGPITVATTNGIAVSATNFFLPPSITVFTPTNGATGANVTITGVNFTNATLVSFNGTSATFTVLNNSSISAIVPLNATSGPISVTAPGGSATTTNNFFVRPTVSGFSPGSGVAGNSVTITGGSFTNATAVLFNGVSSTNFTVLNNSQITAIVPANATTGPISVTAPGGTGVSAQNFVVDALTLSIRLLTNNAVSISWTTNAIGFSLQANTNLNALTNWVAVTNVPVVTSGRNTVTNSITNSGTFYRLKK
ncbi:MAG: IPT/TIG domain-containing protein [Verrucomicrobiota bacterium]